MILDQFIEIKIGPQNKKYWTEKGYTIGKVGSQKGGAGFQIITVKISDLQPKSNFQVNCKCDDCGKLFMKRFSQGTDICYFCYGSKKMKGNSLGSVNKGKPNYKQRGENSPRWNPNKTEFQHYRNKVNWQSEKQYVLHIHEINPNCLPRTLCGVEGGYQLDHIKSVKTCFDENITIEDCSSYINLQMLPWSENRQKW